MARATGTITAYVTTRSQPALFDALDANIIDIIDVTLQLGQTITVISCEITASSFRNRDNNGPGLYWYYTGTSDTDTSHARCYAISSANPGNCDWVERASLPQTWDPSTATGDASFLTNPSRFQFRVGVDFAEGSSGWQAYPGSYVSYTCEYKINGIKRSQGVVIT